MPFKGNIRIAAACALVIVAMLVLVGFSLPLYRAFCEATGFAGTTRRADADTVTATSNAVTVRFDTEVDSALPWRFGPDQKSVTTELGKQTLVYFWAENTSDQTIIGHATYNVMPDLAGQYFTKIQCFCFDDEELGPHQRVEMPVSFYVDPKILKDPDIHNVPVITLSYTFFRSAAPNDVKNLDRFGATTTTNAVVTGDAERGAHVFNARCAACHKLDHNLIGPMLGGVGGRAAGSVSGFSYSNALKNAALTWNAASLDRWLQDPRADLPGVRMTVTLPDPQARADVIAYLLQNSAGGP